MSQITLKDIDTFLDSEPDGWEIGEAVGVYAALHRLIKGMEDRKAALSKGLVKTMGKKGMTAFDAGFASVTRYERHNWKYTKEVDYLKEQLKIEKDSQQAEGTATKETAYSVRITLNDK